MTELLLTPEMEVGYALAQHLKASKAAMARQSIQTSQNRRAGQYRRGR